MSLNEPGLMSPKVTRKSSSGRINPERHAEIQKWLHGWRLDCGVNTCARTLSSFWIKTRMCWQTRWIYAGDVKKQNGAERNRFLTIAFRLPEAQAVGFQCELLRFKTAKEISFWDVLLAQSNKKLRKTNVTRMSLKKGNGIDPNIVPITPLVLRNL